MTSRFEKVLTLATRPDPLLAEGNLWVDEAYDLSNSARDEVLAQGLNLANRLRSRAIDLSSSKPTEFSSDIERLLFMAAKIALISPNDKEVLKQFERDVDYYKRFEASRSFVEDYDTFKQTYRSF